MGFVEVTRKILAERADVLAILPNQPVRLITPKRVDYKQLGQKEI